jgi:hypothetical protein
LEEAVIFGTETIQCLVLPVGYAAGAHIPEERR